MKKNMLLLLFIVFGINNAKSHVELLNPVGGETFSPGDNITISWKEVVMHNTLNWDLYFSKDGGTIWEALQLDIPITTLNYQWNIPVTETTQGIIKIVQDNMGDDYIDASGNFTISSVPVISDPLLADAGPDTVYCADNLNIESIGGNPSAIGGVPPYTYAWSAEYEGVTRIFTASWMLEDTTVSNPVFKEGSIPDSVVLYLTVKDANDSLSFDSLEVRLSSYVSCLGECIQNIRLGDSVKLSHCISGGLSPHQFSWAPSESLTDSTLEFPWAKPLSNATYNLTITDSYGCQANTNCKVFIDATDIVSVKVDGNFIHVYPNPASDRINISIDPFQYLNSTLEIFNQDGLLIREAVINKTLISINVLGFAPGVYLYRWKSGNNIIESGKIIIR